MRFILGVIAVIGFALAGADVSPAAESGSGNGEFNIPNSIATDSAGNLYVSDGDNSRIQKFSPNGRFLTKWGSLGSADGQFGIVGDLDVDSSNNVYVTDADNSRIEKFSSSGAFMTKWGEPGTGNGQFTDPSGIAVGPQGNVYVSERENPRIQKFTPSGDFILQWGSEGNGQGEFQFPGGLAVDSTAVYVADSDNERIQKFAGDGTFLSEWGGPGEGDGQFNQPWDLGADALGKVYVADKDNNRIQVFSQTGGFIFAWGGSGTGKGEFNLPTDVTVDPSGNVYVADSENNRIQKFTGEGAYLDLVPPAPIPRPARPTITSAPKHRTRKHQARFRFESSQAGVLFQCRLTGKRARGSRRSWRSCTSPKRYSKLRTGKWSFRVRAVRSGRAGKPARFRWRIVKARRRHEPKLPIRTIPVARNKARVKFPCTFDYRCLGRVTITRGKLKLAEGKYSVAPGSTEKLKIPMTPAGRAALARTGSVRARLTVVGKRTKKPVTVPVLLKRS